MACAGLLIVDAVAVEVAFCPPYPRTAFGQLYRDYRRQNVQVSNEAGAKVTKTEYLNKI